LEGERKICGNGPSRARTSALLRPGSRTSVAALTGPSGLGKRSFLEQELQEVVEESDRVVVDYSVDGAREAASFLRARPLFSPFRAAVVDGVGLLSEPAQDAYLRLCEEPPQTARVFFVVEDDGLLLPALRSRLQEVVRWRPLDQEDMEELLESHPVARDPEALALCRGIPGLYEVMLGRPEYPVLSSVVAKIVGGCPDPLSVPVPEAVSSLSGKPAPERDAVAAVCRSAALSRVGDPAARARILAFLRFSAVLVRHSAANAEVHWQRAAVSCSL